MIVFKNAIREVNSKLALQKRSLGKFYNPECLFHVDDKVIQMGLLLGEEKHLSKPQGNLETQRFWGSRAFTFLPRWNESSVKIVT